MLEAMPSDRAPIHLLAVLFAIGFVVVNAAFFFLSGSYFASHHQIVGGNSVPTFSPAEQTHIRVVFGAMSGIVTAVAFLANLARRPEGHALAALLGVVNLVFGVFAFLHDQPGALITILLVTGLVIPVLAYLSYRRSRAAWAFLVALCAVCAVAGLFGSPKISKVLDVSLWTTMIYPSLYGVACVMLALLRDDYAEPASARRA